jgi:hypothetical protein
VTNWQPQQIVLLDVRNDTIEPLTTDQVSFRARSKLPARKREIALSVGRLAIEFHDWMSRRYHLPFSDLPSLNKPDPETAATIVRARWSLGSAPIGNTVHLLESHGVRVFSLAPEYSEVDLDHRRSKQSGLTGDMDLTSESDIAGDDLPVVESSRDTRDDRRRRGPGTQAADHGRQGRHFPRTGERTGK